MQVEEALIHPTVLVRVTQVADDELVKKAINEAKELSNENVTPMGHSNVNCYRTILPNTQSPNLNLVCQSIEEKLSKVLADKKINLMFGTEFWLNVNGKESSNDAHAHYGSAISGVYYLSADGTGPLVFHSIQNKMGTTSYCDQAQADFSIYPTDNSMVVFPSWALHSVSNNTSNTDRICIAFNAR